MCKGKPALSRDDVAALCITRVKLSYDAWDNATCSGPVPVLFSRDPTSTVTKLRAFPSTAFDVCQALAARLFQPTCLSSPTEAISYLKDPTDPRSKRPLIREWVEPTAHKKPRAENQFGSNQQHSASGRCP